MGSVFSAEPAKKDGPLKIVGPDGQPVTEATVYVVYETSVRNSVVKWEVKKFDLKDSKGFSSSNSGKFRFLVIDSPGCALGIWQHGLTELKLEKEFFIEGSVIDTKGEPVSGAELTIGRFGVSTYLNVHLNRTGDALPWFQTKTDKNGRYRFRGAIIERYDFDSGAKILARATQNGVLMVGEKTQSFAGDIPFFAKTRKVKSHWGDSPLSISPTDNITGLVIDAQTGKPLPGAIVNIYGLKYENTTSRSLNVTTGKDGRFEISKMRIDHLNISCKGYQYGRLLPEKTWRNSRFTKLNVPLRPLVNVRGRLIDTHSKGPPVLPLSLEFEFSDPAGKGWTLDVGKHCGSKAGNEFKTQPDGTFSRKLPAGNIRILTHLGRGGRRNDPYAKTFEKNISAKGNSNLKLPLERKPGVLFKLKQPKEVRPSKAEGIEWERVVINLKAVGGSGSSSTSSGYPYAFRPVAQWGDKMNVRVELQRAGPNALLMDQDFVANPDTWPIMIDAAELRERIRDSPKKAIIKD